MSLVDGLQLVIRFEGDVPERFVCGTTRYRVTDTPTRLEDELSVLTHPIDLTGWRFQGTDDDGTSHMFDIVRRGDRWELLRIWD
jgi:hypothetical protein